MTKKSIMLASLAMLKITIYNSKLTLIFSAVIIDSHFDKQELLVN